MTHLTVKASLANVLQQVLLAAVISVENTTSADQLPLQSTSTDKRSGRRKRGEKKKRKKNNLALQQKKNTNAKAWTKRLPFPVSLRALRSVFSRYLVLQLLHILLPQHVNSITASWRSGAEVRESKKRACIYLSVPTDPSCHTFLCPYVHW